MNRVLVGHVTTACCFSFCAFVQEYSLQVLNFDLENFQRIHGLEILSQLKQKKKSQLCIIKTHFKSRNSLVALESTPRPLFMFTITLQETRRKQLPNVCSIHHLGESRHSEERLDLGGLGSKPKASVWKSTLSPSTAILSQMHSAPQSLPRHLRSEPSLLKAFGKCGF